jgi:hypothetical protein
MFDLKNVQKEEWLSKDGLLEYVNEYDVYAYYLGNFNVGNVFSSPFRVDRTPSFGIYLGNNGVLMFNDYKLGSGDCFKFVAMMENCSYYDAMVIVNKRYNVNFRHKRTNISSLYTKPPLITNTKVLEKEEVWIDINIRAWELHDREYWSKYEISLSTLTYFNVFPINKFWINGQSFNTDKIAYAYYFGDRIFKIYQPYKIQGKWWSNIKDKERYQGYDQLPDSGDILFITSSLKDVMVLYEAGFSAIAPHTEHQILSEGNFIHYSQNWELMTVLYDNDDAGILHAKKMQEKFGLKYLLLPESDTKDPSDFVEKYDLSTLKKWINNQL